MAMLNNQRVYIYIFTRWMRLDPEKIKQEVFWCTSNNTKMCLVTCQTRFHWPSKKTVPKSMRNRKGWLVLFDANGNTRRKINTQSILSSWLGENVLWLEKKHLHHGVEKQLFHASTRPSLMFWESFRPKLRWNPTWQMRNVHHKWRF